MLQVVTLLLALAQAPQEPLTIKGELKELPAQGNTGPLIFCEGTTNLPNGVSLLAQLYYGKPVPGKELFTDSAIVKAGRVAQDFPVFSKRNFPGTYTARLTYDPVLQGLEAPNYPRTTLEFVLRIGGPQDVDREGKAVRDELIGELRALLVIADEIKAKLDEMKDKPQAEREVPYKAWHERSQEIRKQVDPRKHPEYYILALDLVADSGMEDLTGILMSSARCFVLNQRENMVEGLTRLRQSCDYWIGEVGSARVLDFSKLADSVDECRAIAKKLLEHAGEPVPPARRRFLELIAGLDKSAPPTFHDLILAITTKATAFFNGVSDKSPDTKQLHEELDRLLIHFAGTLRNFK
jgi:hypothetical protein